MATHPSQIEAEIRQVILDTRSGHLELARTRVDRLLEEHPGRADVRMAKGMLLMSFGDYSSSLEWLNASLELNPMNAEALAWAAFLNINLESYGEAEAMARSFVELAPSNPRSYFLLAKAKQGLGQTKEAIEAIDQSLALRPGDPESLVLKARLLRDWNLPGLAIEFYKQAQAKQPYPAAAIELARIWLREGRPEEALHELLTVEPMLPAPLKPDDMIAQAYTELMEFDNAEIHWKRAEKTGQDRVWIVHLRASSEIAVGRFTVAEEILTRAIEQDIEQGVSFYLLTTGRKMTPDDMPLIDQIVSQVESCRFEPGERAKANFGLGKAFDDLGDFERAIGFFDEANRTVRASFKPKTQSFLADARAFGDFMIAYFTKDRLERLRVSGLGGSAPLLVVGMHRSGTTLTDSILSCHSKVRSRGEQLFWMDRIAECFRVRDGKPELKFELVAQFAADYLRLLEPGEPGVLHVVDKNPANYQFVPMIHWVLPNVKFVHLKRNAVDNLLSMWMTPFSEELSYLCDRANLVEIYREYLRLMAHVDSVMPTDRFKTFWYEELTSDPETVVGSMLEFVGLPFEEACLHPESSKRAVLTPSVHQVRQPISTRSQNRWKNYEPWLGPFAELLGS